MVLSLSFLAADVVTVAASVPPSGNDTTPEPSAATAPPAAAEPAPLQWYGWQTILVDAVSAATLVGLLAYPVGAPIVHAAHGRWVTAGLDAGLRLALPLLSGWLAFQAAYRPCTGDCSNVWFPTGTTEALVAGVVAAGAVSIFDAAVLSWEPRAPESVPAATPHTGLQWTPTAIAVRGGALAGIGGRF
jgi:hypothetical protein